MRETLAKVPALRCAVALALCCAAAPSLAAEPSHAHGARAEKAASERKNGFALADAAVPAEKIVRGADRDQIHAVDEPEHVAPEDATLWVRAETPVLGLALEGEARAYPIHLLEFHQIVNDELGGAPVAVTYDPLAGTPLAYRARVDGQVLHFGVSGLLYQSNFLLYDRETRSLWSQMLGEALAGPLRGKRLERIRVRQEPMGVWLGRHPQTRVLARPEPTRIDYRYSPFSVYWVSEKIPYPVDHRDERYHPKEVVLGVEQGGVSRAYLGSILTAIGGRIIDRLAGQELKIAYDPATSTFVWDVPESVRVTEAYWFAWKTFHPDTEVWEPEAPAGAGAGDPG